MSNMSSTEAAHVEYVLIAETDSSDTNEREEFQLETDGTLLVSTLQVQYPNATGIKYRNPETGTYRTLKVVGDRIHAPTDSQGWRDRVFIVVRPKELAPAVKRADVEPSSTANEPPAKQARKDSETTSTAATTTSTSSSTDVKPPKVDLIVLGLSYTADENEVEDFFQEFGDLELVEIKRKPDGSSRGFAFVRFKSQNIQRKVLLGSPYHMAGRTINVRRADIKNRDADSSRLFITKLTSEVYPKDLEEYFSQYGKVVDVFIPRKNFRGFGFLTFENCDSVNEVLDDGENHCLKNDMNIVVSRAMPRAGPMPPMSNMPPPRGAVDHHHHHHQPHMPPYHDRMRSGGGGGGGGSSGGAPSRLGEGPSLLQDPIGQSSNRDQMIYQAVKKVLQEQPGGAEPPYGDYGQGMYRNGANPPPAPRGGAGVSGGGGGYGASAGGAYGDGYGNMDYGNGHGMMRGAYGDPYASYAAAPPYDPSLNSGMTSAYPPEPTDPNFNKPNEDSLEASRRPYR